MCELGLQACGFSGWWSRIRPGGTGRVNQAGLAFYSRLVDELLANDIEPLLTLYHWALPAALDDRGGWLNRDSADWFAEYGRVLYLAPDGRVKKCVTPLEPSLVTDGASLPCAPALCPRTKSEAAAAGPTAPARTGAPSTAAFCTARSTAGGRSGSRSTSPGWSPTAATCTAPLPLAIAASTRRRSPATT